jgi:DmsE family decaheme c-type cytochrome
LKTEPRECSCCSIAKEEVNESLTMKKLKALKRSVFFFCGLLCLNSLFSVAEQQSITPNNTISVGDEKQLTIPLKSNQKLSEKGADTCLKCHDEDSKTSILAIFKTPHGNKSVSNGPFASHGTQCEACHGPAGEHAKSRLSESETRQPMIAFKALESFSLIEKNKICLSCHQSSSNSTWFGSAHQIEGTSCTGCHKIHVKRDPMMDNVAQVEQCGSCHLEARLAHQRRSAHPLKEGRMGCSDCHQPHDSHNEKMLISDSVNTTCYTCHAEKRGPYLWEHEPVADNCSHCHSPHGSNIPAMLTQRAPLLCQSCHSSVGHASVSYIDRESSSNNSSIFLLGRSCINCHAQVHGSNHPSGPRLQQ